MDKLQSILKWICIIIFTVCGSIMVVLLTANGLGRYIFSRGIVWADEITRLMFVWGCFTGITYALVTDSHIGFDFFPSRNKWTKMISDFVNGVCIIVIGYVITRYGQLFITRVGGVPLPASGVPIRYLYSAGMLAGVAWIIVGVFKLVKLAAGFKNSLESTAKTEGGKHK